MRRSWRSRSFGLIVLGVISSVGCAQLLGIKEDVPAAPCVLNSDCAPSELCIFRVCSAACKLDKDCAPGARCLDAGGAAACVQAQNATCTAETASSVCPAGAVCDASQVCRNSCANCHSDQTCVNGACVGTDPNHDPGAGGSGGNASVGGAGGNTSGGTSGSSATNGGDGSTNEAGAAGATSAPHCGATAAGDTAPCSELPDGTVINFPGGKAQGPCALGTKLCQADGTFGKCTGAIAPGTTDCSSSADKNCDGKADNSECGVCTVAATQYCYDGDAKTKGVGACKQGTQVCQLDASGKSTVWGPCAGEVTPAAADTCDSGNDANCNNAPNEGCTCINGQTGTCGDKLQALGNCAAGSTKCAAGSWGACSVVAKGKDSCDKGDDADCDGSANENCGCFNGDTMSCGTSGTGCTLGVMTCQAGAYGGCAGNTCVDFAVTPPTDKCTATGPKGDTVEVSCTAPVCPAGYYVSDCTLHASAAGVSCSFQGFDSADHTVADYSVDTNLSGASCSCSFTACTCRRDGF